MNADSIKIDCDEDGFHLIVETDEDTFDFHIHGIAVELLAEVKREIEPSWSEGQAVLASMKADGEFPDERVVAIREDGSYRVEQDDDAYPLYDPKHPDFHENFSALHDNREEKCSPLCGAVKAYGRFVKPWQHERDCPARGATQETT